jgi:hypothetical protein
MRAAKPWYLLAATMTMIVVWHAWSSQFNHDEIEHLHASWLVAQGQVPFADFLEQHHPTLWYLLAPATRWFPSVHVLVFAARLADLGLLAVLLALFVRIVRRTYPDVDVRLPTLVLASSFMLVRNTMEVRPDPLMNALLYGGLLCWVAFVQEGRRRRAFAAGLLFGAAVAVLQKAIVVVALVAAASLLLAVLRGFGGGSPHRDQGARRTRLLVGTLAMLAGAALPVGALFLFVAARGIFRDFWFWNYQFNRFFYLQAVLTKHFSVLVTLGISLAVDPVLWIAGGAGMLLCARDLWRDLRGSRPRLGAIGEARLGLLVVALGYLPFLCANRFPLEQYFIVFLPLLALFSAEVFLRVSAPRPRAWLERSALLMVAILAAVALLYPGNGPQRQVQALVLAQTAPGQAVFVPPAYNPIFRPHSGYFWYNASLIGDAYAQYCLQHSECPGHKGDEDRRRWSAAPPAFVYLQYPEYSPYRWCERSAGYRPTEVPGLLRADDLTIGPSRSDPRWGLRPQTPGEAR